MNINGCGNNRRQVKKIWSIGSIIILLMLFPSVAYAHEFSSFPMFFWGVNILFQLFYGVILLGWKRKELEASRFVVSGLYVGILGILGWGITYGFPWLIIYLFPEDLFEDAPILVWVILLLLYFFGAPIVSAVLLARTLYRWFREPLSTTETHGGEEKNNLGRSEIW